jgi:hypothetical protein
MDSRICQTSTASPAEPGELSYLFSADRGDSASNLPGFMFGTLTQLIQYLALEYVK